jgi:hypothetical protein
MWLKKSGVVLGIGAVAADFHPNVIHLGMVCKTGPSLA